MTPRPPFAARVLLRVFLPARVHEQVAGDLEEDWNATADARRFWRGAVRSIWDSQLARARTVAPAPGTGEIRMHALAQDLRYGWRSLIRQPGYAAAAIVTLALGIGATAAVFAIIDVLAFKPLAYRDPSRLAFVLGMEEKTGHIRFSMRVAHYLDLRDTIASFEAVGAYAYVSANLTGGDIPERVQAYAVTANTFDMLGVAPAHGRSFGVADTSPGAPAVVMLSDGLWRRRFGADPGAVGRTVTINGRVHQIIGVMPPRFEYPIFNYKGDAWIPWSIDESAARLDRAASGSATLVARLRPGVQIATAQAEVRAAMRRIEADLPSADGGLTATVIEMGRLDDEQAGPAFIVAAVAVALVLLLACANVANLLLARGVARARELAVRAAVGATRWRILRQLTIEALLLAVLGAAAGLLVARAALHGLVAMLPEAVLTTVPNISTLGIDRTVLGFGAGLTIVVALLAGSLPAWRGSRADLRDGLKEGAATGGSHGTRRLRSILVVAEVGLATLLVIAATLLTKSYAGLNRLDPGFDPDGVLTVAMSLPPDRYPTPPARQQFYDALLARLAGFAEVESAGMVNVLPFSTYDRGTRFILDGAPLPPPGEEPSSGLRIASPGYFSTLGIPLKSGRWFDGREREGSERVAIVNQTFVTRHLGDGDPLGRRVRLGVVQSDSAWMTIVGVVGDVHHWQLTQAPDPEIYVPLPQATNTGLMMLAVRTDGDAQRLIPAVRAAVLAIDPMQPVYHVRTMSRMLDDARIAGTTSTWLMGIFSTIAVVLAVVGIYGVVSYGVTQQLPEFGVRLALGASRSHVASLVVWQAVRLVLCGVALGIGAAWLVSAGLASLLVGISGRDPVSYVTAAAAVIAFGALASLVPAFRAAAIGPLRAMRGE